MPNVKISELPSITLPYNGSESLLLVQSQTTKSGSLSTLNNYLSSSLASIVNTTSVLSAMSAATDLQKQSILPNTVVVDYFQTADQTGYTIPAYSYSRKGNVPYFGNAPIGNGAQDRFIRKAISNTTTGPYRWNQPVATFDMPSGALVEEGTNFYLDIDILIEYNQGDTIPGVSDLFLAFSHEAELSNVVSTKTSDIMIDVGVLQSGQYIVNLKGNWVLNSQPSGTFSGGRGSFQKSDFNETTRVTNLRNLVFGDDYGCSYGEGPSSPGVAETISLILLPTTNNFVSCVISGRVSLIVDCSILP